MNISKGSVNGVKALVIGYGSIGSRHARILRELGCETAAVSRRRIDFRPTYPDVFEAVRSQRPDYAVIANETSTHHATLLNLRAAGFHGTVLTEKPLFDRCEKVPSGHFQGIFVAYNLRFHPLIQRLKSLLQSEVIVSAQAYVGKYLPRWGTDRDYRSRYSARRSAGGGVLRDLSHELDYLNWIFGGWKRLTALGGHLSSLDIDSDDAYAILMVTEKCPLVSLQMNYLDRASRRELLINTRERTYKADFIKGTLEIDETTENFKVNQDDTYRAEHTALLNRDFSSLCSLEEGMEVVEMIEAAEKAAEKRVWVYR